MGRLRYRQVFLFLMVLILPTLAIGWQGLRIINQERDLDRALAEKQAEDVQKRMAAEVGQDLLARLERIKLQAMADSPAAIPQPGRYSDPAVVLIGRVDGERLLWPWDDPANSGVVPPGEDAEFDKKLREAERVELTEKERSASLYRALADAARTDAQRAEARLGLARALREIGSQAEIAAIYRELLNLPWNVTDEWGLSFAGFAASGLTKLNAHREVLGRVMRDLDSTRALPPKETDHLKAVLHLLTEAADPQTQKDVEAALQQLSARVAEIDKSRNLKEVQDLQRDFAALKVTEFNWKPYDGPAGDLWLVSRSPSGATSSSLAIVVRAEAVLKEVETSRNVPFRVAANGDVGRPLGPHLPQLRVTFPENTGATGVAESGLQESVYGLSLLIVVPLTFLSGYLLWRDTRRETRIAELRSQFVSSVSHELKTPLTSIRMFAETLQIAESAGSSDPKVRSEYFDIIVNESERLTRLLNNVLDFSRVERGEKSYHLESADLPEVLDAAVRTMRFPLVEQGFDLQVAMCEDLPPLPIDRDAMEQAVLNLLSNAMKYSGKSRDIELRLSRQNGSALIQVSDHGIGIPADEQRRIFERFYRVSSSENRTISGTGLGLALVAHIVNAHGGTIDVRSAPGEGSTFSIRIPVAGSES